MDSAFANHPLGTAAVAMFLPREGVLGCVGFTLVGCKPDLESRHLADEGILRLATVG